MSAESVRSLLVSRLEQADRGDRGWFIATRVHVALSWLKSIAEYVDARGNGGAVALDEADYLRLGTLIETGVPDPGVLLRRHHLLVMDKPLQLLRRVREPFWNQVALTPLGRSLASEDDAAAVLERALAAIRFAAAPWTPSARIREYHAFDLNVYQSTLDVLRNCDGYLDRDEFDFFLSRVRTADEVPWAIEGVRAFRGLSLLQRQELRLEVARRIPGAKAYQNWRDVALHTFSIFSLGTSVVRDGHRLVETAKWATSNGVRELVAPGKLELKVPKHGPAAHLLAPPAAVESNSGSDAESFVAKVLRSQGWQVVFYTNRRGYGFDLWARRGGAAMLVEVKSSLGRLGNVELTPNEYDAACRYGANYCLALVEGLGEDTPRLVMIPDPVAKCAVTEKKSRSYVLTRVSWSRAVAPSD